MSVSTIRALMGVINNALVNSTIGDARNEAIEASRQIEVLLSALERQPAPTEGRLNTDELAKQWNWLSGTLDDGTYRVMMYQRGTGLFEETPLVGDGQNLDEALRAALQGGEVMGLSDTGMCYDHDYCCPETDDRGCPFCTIKQLEQRIAVLEDDNAGLAAAADSLLACAYHCADEH